MKYLIIIPARKGSKAIPDKNITLLDGKPLISYTFELAKQTGFDICVSTDDARVIELAAIYDIEVPFVRPKKYATDTATTDSVVKHALQTLTKKYESIILLQPTSPLRKLSHVTGSLELYEQRKPHSVITVSRGTDYPLTLDNHQIQPLINAGASMRQECQPTYYINGSVYVTNVKALENHNYNSQSLNRLGYITPEEESLDIDTYADLDKCEYLLTR